MIVSNDSDNSYFDDQFEAWFEGGKEWYEESTGAKQEGIPGDFDPYVFWAETAG